VTADQAEVADMFWMRAIPQPACSKNNSTDNIRGIVYYGNITEGIPTTTGNNNDSIGCLDQSSSLSPVVPKSVSANSLYYENETVTLGTSSSGLLIWQVNNVSMLVDWQDPSLLQIYNHEDDWTSTEGVIQLDEANEWAYVLIQSSLAVPHPIHLHGHDFFILEQGTGDYDPSNPLPDLSNPPRRDTALLLAGGHLLIAFQTDNPGAWLMHCHIGFHTVEGLALQFIEQYSNISSLIDNTTLLSNCEGWDNWQDSQNLVDDDDGL
jgi:Multicopper oxidase